MRQQLDRMGTRSFELLMARMRDPRSPYVLERISPVFMVRESCGCEPAGRRTPHRIPMSKARAGTGRRPGSPLPATPTVLSGVAGDPR
jgi:hypothetical protein